MDTRLKILLVEDEPIARLALSYILEDHGMAVASAANASDAMQLLQSEIKFDCIVADQHLGSAPTDYSGLYLLHRAERMQPEAGRLLLTADSSLRREDTSTEFVLLFKPVAPPTLLGIISRMGTRAQKARERRRLGHRPTDPALPAIKLRKPRPE